MPKRISRKQKYRKGRSYEILVQGIFQTLLKQDSVQNISVEHDLSLPGKTLTHQIDVYWKFQMGGVQYETIVQAKDWAKPVSQGELILFKGVLDDLSNQPRGIFVTRSGFQRGAKEYASANGIILYELHEAPTDNSVTLRVGDWAVGKPVEISLQGKPAGEEVVVSEMALGVAWTIFEPHFSNIRFEADMPWFEQESLSSAIDKSDLTLSVPGVLYDESHSAVGNIEGILRKAVEGMKEEKADKKHVVATFEHPTFLHTTYRDMGYFKVTSVSFDVEIHTRQLPLRFSFSKFVQFALHEILSGNTRTFAFVKPKE